MTDLRTVVEKSLRALRVAIMDRVIAHLEAAPNKAEPLGPGESWEYDDGLTMNRKVYRHGKLTEVIPIEIIQDTPQMRPFRVAHSFGNREHRPKDRIPQTFEDFLATDAGVRLFGLELKDEWIDAARAGWEAAMRAKQENV